SALSDLLPSNLKGLSILDAGCGDGSFAGKFSSKGAKVTGIDGSSSLITIAKRKFPDVKFLESDLLKPMPLPDTFFDLIFANMLLMHLSDISMFLSESRRTIKPTGTLIFSILHPCFNHPVTKLKKSFTDKVLNRGPKGESFDYFDQPGNRRFESVMDMELTHYHRTLEQYAKALSENRFAIDDLREPHELPPEYLKNHPKHEYATRLPRFLFFKAKPL
ncbi:MAG: class I SAM-dependent methyltransferase, partial [Acidobacteriaceae bacterium]